MVNSIATLRFPPCLPSLQTPIHKDIHKGGAAEGRPHLCGLPHGWVPGGWVGKEEIPPWYLNAHHGDSNYHHDNLKHQHVCPRNSIILFISASVHVQKDARRKDMKFGGTETSRSLTRARLVTKTISRQNRVMSTFATIVPPLVKYSACRTT